MPTTSKNLFRGTATTSVITLYTVPASTTTVITNIAVANTTGSAQTFTLGIGAATLGFNQTIAANSTAYIDLKQVINAGEIIQGGASATFSVQFHISGVEIS